MGDQTRGRSDGDGERSRRRRTPLSTNNYGEKAKQAQMDGKKRTRVPGRGDCTFPFLSFLLPSFVRLSDVFTFCCCSEFW